MFEPHKSTEDRNLGYEISPETIRKTARLATKPRAWRHDEEFLP